MVDAVLNDWRNALVNDQLKAALGFLEKLTLRPADVTVEDMRVLQTAGLSDGAIREVVYVCFIFSIMDRLADAFDFQLPDESQNRMVARAMNAIGYRVAHWLG